MFVAARQHLVNLEPALPSCLDEASVEAFAKASGAEAILSRLVAETLDGQVGALSAADKVWVEIGGTRSARDQYGYAQGDQFAELERVALGKQYV